MQLPKQRTVNKNTALETKEIHVQMLRHQQRRKSLWCSSGVHRGKQQHIISTNRQPQPEDSSLLKSGNFCLRLHLHHTEACFYVTITRFKTLCWWETNKPYALFLWLQNVRHHFTVRIQSWSLNKFVFYQSVPEARRRFEQRKEALREERRESVKGH